MSEDSKQDIPKKRPHDQISSGEVLSEQSREVTPSNATGSNIAYSDISNGKVTYPQNSSSIDNFKPNKRTTACTACHKSKVKCVQPEPNKPCLRCVKANKQCIVDTKVVKKKHKLSTQLIEYEKQIKLLTAKVDEQQTQIDLLKSEKKSINMQSDEEETLEDINNYFKGSNSSQRQSSVQNERRLEKLQEKRKKNHYKSSISYYLNLRSKEELLQEYSIMSDLKLQRYFTVSTNFTLIGHKRDEILKLDYYKETDVVGQGHLTQEEINLRLKYYMEKMYPLYGIVSILDSTHQNIMPSEVLRRRSPFLYMAILAISSITISKKHDRFHSLDTHLRLNVKSIELIIHEIMVVGSKSIELLQALLLMSLWYDSAELLQHRRYHLMNMLCVSLMEELGLNGKTIFYFSKAESIAKRAPLIDISQSLQSRKLALAVYSSNICYSIFLKRESMIKWNPYFEECCTILSNSKNENYQKIAIFAELNHYLEKIHHSLHQRYFDLTNINFFSDKNKSQSKKKLLDEQLKKDEENLKINLLITNFHDLLMKIKSRIPPENKFCLIYYYSVEAYLFEPFNYKILEDVEEDTKEEEIFDKIKITPFIIAKINNCAASCMNAFNCYYEYSNEVLSALPLTFQSRVFYLSGTLLRLRYLITLINNSYQSKLKSEQKNRQKNDEPNTPKDSGKEQNIVFLNTLTSLPEDLLEKLLENLERNYTTSNDYPYNYFLPKSRLMLILYLSTYSNQILETLAKKYQMDKKSVSQFLKSNEKNKTNKSSSTTPTIDSNNNNLKANEANKKDKMNMGMMNPTDSNNKSNNSSNMEKFVNSLISPPIYPRSDSGTPSPSPSQQTMLQHPTKKSQQELLNNINILNFLFDNTGTAKNVGIDTPPANMYSASTPTTFSPSSVVGQNPINSMNSNIMNNVQMNNKVNEYPTDKSPSYTLSLQQDASQSFQSYNKNGVSHKVGSSASPSGYFSGGHTASNSENTGIDRSNMSPEAGMYSTSNEYSFWALNDNMWNDLLMGVDFGMLRGPSNTNTGSNGVSTPGKGNSAAESTVTVSSAGKNNINGAYNNNNNSSNSSGLPVDSPVSFTGASLDEGHKFEYR